MSRARNRIPLAAPENLDDVPARAAEGGFEFLNDLAVAAHRAVEALQVAVDDKNQVVELFARSQGDRAERFGLVGFAVAQKRPDFCVGLWLKAAIFKITGEARLIDRHQRAKAHRDGGIFPEIRASATDADKTIRPPPGFSSRRKFSSFCVERRPSRNARE